MQKFFLLLLLLPSVFSFSQPGGKLREKGTTKPLIDSGVSIKLKQLSDSVKMATQLADTKEKQAGETNEIQENLQRSNDYFLLLQKERRAKEKKAAFIRIAIGIGFLIILIIGLRRKSKKTGE